MIQTGATVYTCDRCKKIHVNTLLEGETFPKDWGMEPYNKELCSECDVLYNRIIQAFYSPKDFKINIGNNGTITICEMHKKED